MGERESGCYICGKDDLARCPRCNRSFCSDHGLGLCQECNSRWEALQHPTAGLPSPLLYYSALATLLVAMLVGGWLILAWPRSFERLPSASETPSLAIKDSTPPVSIIPSPTAKSTPQPSPTATPQPPSPTPMPAPSPTPSPAPLKEYIVQSGDTLIAIAARFGVAANALARFNNLSDEDFLRLGQVLVIPP